MSKIKDQCLNSVKYQQTFTLPYKSLASHTGSFTDVCYLVEISVETLMHSPTLKTWCSVLTLLILENEQYETIKIERKMSLQESN